MVTRSRARDRWAVAAVVITVVTATALAACGDDDGAGTGPSPAPSGDVATEDATPSDTPSASETPGKLPSGLPTDPQTPPGEAGDGTGDGTTGDDGQGALDGAGMKDSDPDGDVPFPANTEPDTQSASADAALTVTAVRIGAHDDYDRVVLELAGTGTPGWRAAYVDAPTEDGSGAPVDVDGDAVLSLRIEGTTYPFETGATEYGGANPLRVAGTDVVTEVVYSGVFEGVTTAFVGVDDEKPFRVYSLTDPTRVVVDVRDD
ncbi:hypothetical protein GCM10025865_23900 [Paraoerskovia sediminicola]|uniref:AMIN-like domain-containing protein n=1 Tax=Paraoerskovia sediminicola TaxID=1138587 RepID=A0ABN6XE23_9CELL|nr:hypothetical protein [Paraoerskovia sediminicola]BDZ43091.1 hypothetical protein GCM10025865_23900 [Paraoerskovia sediminicola]